MVAANFDPEAAVRYWRHLPSGLGKHDTLQMAELNPNDLARHWDAAFRARVYTYPEEEQFLRIMTTRFAGRRVTSVGSGLGFQELVYAKHGAHVRCIDVVHSNLTVVRRVAQLKGLEVETLLVNDLNNPVYGQPNSQDVVLFYGSLMTMPTPLQARATNEAFRLLKERGAVIFMLYTWEFARHSCGWTDPADFDPTVFARASDPSVAGEDCPWSDWHDEAKLLALAPRDVYVRHAQSWNQGFYAWFELRSRAQRSTSTPFFSEATLRQGHPSRVVTLAGWEPAEGDVLATPVGLRVSGRPGVSYAALSPVIGRLSAPLNALSVDITLSSGAIALGVLDVDQEHFIASLTITQPGRHRYLLRFAGLPTSWRIVISNHDPQHETPSSSILHDVSLLQRPTLEPP